MNLLTGVVRGVFEQGSNINAVKVIRCATVVTVQGNFPLFCHDAIDFAALDRNDS